MGYKYLILGAGKMGEAIMYDLIHQQDTELVTIMDRDKRVLEVGRTLGTSTSVECEYLISDVTDRSLNLGKLFSPFDVVISALPAMCSPRLVDMAINSRVGFCDLGGVVAVSHHCIDMDQRAIREGVPIVIDCGVQPGLGMILARKLLINNPQTKEIGIYVGGMPQKPRPPVFHQNMFSIEGLRHLCYDPVPIFDNGRVDFKPPMSEVELLQVSALRKYSRRFEGRIEAFLSAGASVAPWTFGRYGVKIFEKTLRWPGFVDFVRGIEKPSDFDDAIMQHINVPVDRNNPDFLFMRVVGNGSDGATPYFELLDEFDDSTGLSAMQRTTGFTTAIIARWIAQGKIVDGVSTPEFGIPADLLNEFLDEVSGYFDIKLRY